MLLITARSVAKEVSSSCSLLAPIIKIMFPVLHDAKCVESVSLNNCGHQKLNVYLTRLDVCSSHLLTFSGTFPVSHTEKR